MAGAGYADALLGASQTAFNYGFNQWNKRKQKEIDEAKRQILNAQRDYLRHGDEMQRQDVNRQAYSMGENIKQDANDRGILHSSIPIAATEKLDADRARRIDAINRKADLNEFTWAREDSITDLQKQIKKLQELQGLVNSLYGGGASGGMQYASGTPGV